MQKESIDRGAIPSYNAETGDNGWLPPQSFVAVRKNLRLRCISGIFYRFSQQRLQSLTISYLFQILDDLFSVKNNSSRSQDLEVLQKILEKNHISLNYDGRQMYSKFYEELKNVQSIGSFWKRFQEESIHPPVNTLLPIAKESPLVGDSLEKTNNIDKHNINLIVRLNENPNFVVSVSTDKEEIAVWDVHRYNHY